jgi:hypothetical protein
LKGQIKIKIEVEKTLTYYRRNQVFIKNRALLGDEGAQAVQRLVSAAVADPEDDNLAHMCLAIEEYRRSLLN